MEVTWILLVMKAIHGLMLFDIEKPKANTKYNIKKKEKRCSLLKTFTLEEMFLYSAQDTKAALVFFQLQISFLSGGNNKMKISHVFATDCKV